METQGATRRDIETALIEKCWKDPKEMLERHTGQKLSAEVKIFIHEEDANTLHFSIPPAPAKVAELSDEDLSQVAGGTEIVVSIGAGRQATVIETIGPCFPDLLKQA